jgi:hypothetical protein
VGESSGKEKHECTLTDDFDINNSNYVQQVIDVNLVQLANFLDFFSSIFETKHRLNITEYI